MRHHFVPRGGCRRCSRLGKSAFVAPTLDSVANSQSCAAQGSTLARVHPGIRRSNRSHLAAVRALGVSSSLACPRYPPPAAAAAPTSLSCTPQGAAATRASGRRCHALLRETLPRSCPPRSAATAPTTAPSCTSQGDAATRVPSRSDAVAVPTSPSCAP
jgi:hypothetical protein